MREYNQNFSIMTIRITYEVFADFTTAWEICQAESTYESYKNKRLDKALGMILVVNDSHQKACQ